MTCNEHHLEQQKQTQTQKEDPTPPYARLRMRGVWGVACCLWVGAACDLGWMIFCFVF
jgi:hypothetical protein